MKRVLLVLMAGMAVSSLNSGTTAKLGHALLQLDPDSAAVVGTALFALRQDGALVSEAAVAAVEPISRGRVFVDQRSSSTGVAISNPSEETVEVDLILRDSLGSQVGDTEVLQLGPLANVAELVSQLFPGLAAGFNGSLTFQTRNPSQRVAAVTIRVGSNLDGQPIFATLPVVDLDSPPTGESVIFPHLGAGSGLSTQIILINPTGNEISGSIQFVDSQGQPLELEISGASASTVAFTLQPDGVRAIDLDTPSGIRQGYAVVTASGGDPLPAGTAVFRFTSGEDSISEAGVGAVDATRKARIFVDNVGTQTGVALANPNGIAVTVSLQLNDRQGQPLDTTEVTLPANGHTARFAHELFPGLPGSFTGVLDITSQQPVVPITLKLTFNELGRPILTTLPVADLDAFLDARLLVFPRIGYALGVSTRLILIAGEDAAPVSGMITFLDQAGGALTLEMNSGAASQLAWALSGGAALQIRPEDPISASTIGIDQYEPGVVELAVFTGESIQLRPYVFDGTEARDDAVFEFVVLDDSVAETDAQGRVRGLQPGFTTLAISSGGLLAQVPLSVASLNSGSSGFEITSVVQDLAQRLYLTNSRDHTVLLSESLENPPEIYAGMPETAGLRDDVRPQALFDEPAFLALDQGRNRLYLSDASNHVIRLIGPGAAGEVTTLAGTGVPGFRDGELAVAQFEDPQGVALDQSGRLWVVDSGNHVIRRIDLDAGTVETIAGEAGSPGFQDGDGSAARFNSPVGIALEVEPLAQQLDRELDGLPPPPVSVLIADAGNNAIRRVGEDGTVETIGLEAPSAAGRYAPAGTAPVFLDAPSGVAADSFGNVYVSEPGNGRVVVLLENRQVVPLVGRGRFARPRGLAVGRNGRILVADGANSAQEIVLGEPEIAEITPDRVSDRGGELVTIQGRNFAPGSVVLIGGRRVEAFLESSQAIAFTTPSLPSGVTTLTVINRGGLTQSGFEIVPVPLEELPVGAITTFAGGSTFAGEGRPFGDISVDPSDGVLDAEGNLYVADFANSRIRRVDRGTKAVTTIAGNGDFSSSGDGGVALNASFRGPSGLALSSNGFLYIAELQGHRIRRLELQRGVIETIAGTGTEGFSGDGGPANQARLSRPRGLALDTGGNLYVADSGNHRIRRIDLRRNLITTVAGDGMPRFQGDGGFAPQASLQSPHDVEVGPLGRVWIADTGNQRVRRIDRNGRIRTVAGDSAPSGLPAGQPALSEPTGITLTANGVLVIADRAQHRVFAADAQSGSLVPLAGTGNPGFSGDGGPALEGDLLAPEGVLASAGESMLIFDRGNYRVRRIAFRDRQLETLGGNGRPVFVGEELERIFDSPVRPLGITASEEALYFSDTGRQVVRRIDATSGLVTTVAGIGEIGFTGDGGNAREARLFGPAGLDLDDRNGLILADAQNGRIRRVDLSSGQIMTVAGGGAPGPPREGPPGEAFLRLPLAVAFSPTEAALYIADSGAHVVYRLESSGNMRIVAGTGERGFSGDGGPAALARLNRPVGLALDNQGRVLIVDQGNHSLRRYDPATGLIETICGTGVAGDAGLNGPAAIAQLDQPSAAAADESGNILLSDSDNGRVLQIDSEGLLTLAAGSGKNSPLGDAGPALEASLRFPLGLALHRGNLLIIDWKRSRIRVVRLQ